MTSAVSLLCFLLGLLTVISAVSLSEDSDKEIERGNDYVDKVIDDMREKHGDEYDPYEVEDNVIGFSKKILFVNVSGEAKLHEGRLVGLQSLHRSGDCSLKREGDKLHVRADLAAGVLYLHYSGTVSFQQLGHTISVECKLNYIEVTMEFSVNAADGKDGKLHKFHPDDMRGIECKISGLGPLNWAVNYLIKGIMLIFQRAVKHVTEVMIRDHIERRIRDYDFPVVDDMVQTSPNDITESTPIETTESTPIETTESTPSLETEEPPILPDDSSDV